jgi:hypothetical protein
VRLHYRFDGRVEQPEAFNRAVLDDLLMAEPA